MNEVMNEEYTIQHALSEFLSDPANSRISKIELEFENDRYIEQHTWKSRNHAGTNKTATSSKFLSYPLQGPKKVEHKESKASGMFALVASAAICVLALLL